MKLNSTVQYSLSLFCLVIATPTVNTSSGNSNSAAISDAIIDIFCRGQHNNNYSGGSGSTSSGSGSISSDCTNHNMHYYII